MRDEKIGDFLDRLAGRVPALLGMAARYSTGESYAEHQLAIGRIITEAEELRAIALRLAEADAEAFAVELHDQPQLVVRLAGRRLLPVADHRHEDRGNVAECLVEH